MSGLALAAVISAMTAAAFPLLLAPDVFGTKRPRLGAQGVPDT